MIKKLYYLLARSAHTNLISIIIGMVSGMAINIATGEDRNEQLEAIGWFLAAVAGFIWLNNIRQDIDEEVSTQANKSAKAKEKFQAGADYNNNKTRVWCFFIAFVIGVGCSGKGVYVAIHHDRTKVALVSKRMERLENDSAKLYKLEMEKDIVWRQVAEYLKKVQDTGHKEDIKKARR